jgi:hypothetical protein
MFLASYLEKASEAAREALSEDMAHHFREARDLYETSIGYMMLVVKGMRLLRNNNLELANVGFDVATQKLIGARINDYLERVEELEDVIEGNTQRH